MSYSPSRTVAVNRYLSRTNVMQFSANLALRCVVSTYW